MAHTTHTQTTKVEKAKETPQTVTTQALTLPAQDTPPAEATKRHRRRTVDGRVAGTLRPVYPISAILASATAEEEKRARLLVSELLSYWLGHESKASLARRLAVPQVRVWQMGQRALSGMVAAMLTPPSGTRGAMPRIGPETTALRKRVLELEKETAVQRRLIEVLRTLPSPRPGEHLKEAGSVPNATKNRLQSPRPRTRPATGRGRGPAPGPVPTPAAG